MLRKVLGSFNDPGAIATGKLLDREPGVILGLGDMVYPDGTEADFADCFDPHWGRHKDRIYPVPGNHEYKTPGATPFYAYFGSKAGPSGHGYFSFDSAGWHFVGLNSTPTTRSAVIQQLAWFQNDLEKSKARCVLVYWHHPRFSSEFKIATPLVREFYRIAYQYGVSVALAGHAHSYERFAPLNPSGKLDTKRGIRSFVIGTGGAGMRPVDFEAPHSEAGQSQAHGILRLETNPTGYSWNFRPATPGAYEDSGSSTCVDRFSVSSSGAR